MTTYFFAGRPKSDPFDEVFDECERYRRALEAIAGLDEESCAAEGPEAWAARKMALEALGRLS
jgi:hypothetical protein